MDHNVRIPDQERKAKNKWRDKYAKHSRALDLKERINARRIRAKSTWTAMMEEKRTKGFQVLLRFGDL